LILDIYSRQIGLSAAWARIFFLYGPHENPHRLVASIIQSLLRNESPACSHPDQKLDFLFIEDAASAFVALLESEVSGPVNIGAGRAVSLEEITRTVAAQLKLPDLAAFNGTRPAIGVPPLLVADVERLQKEVGWMPRYDLKQGLSVTIDWWKRSLPER
jgi:nucleoside-diphosphate-sugar epimerase